MSTARQAAAPADGRPSDDCPTAVIPAVPVRRSILRPARPASQDEGAPFADWRGQAVTEGLPAVTAVPLTRPRRPSRRRAVAQHLRAALVGTLLAVVAVSGLSPYAAAGVTSARSNALCQAHITCR